MATATANEVHTIIVEEAPAPAPTPAQVPAKPTKRTHSDAVDDDPVKELEAVNPAKRAPPANAEKHKKKHKQNSLKEKKEKTKVKREKLQARYDALTAKIVDLEDDIRIGKKEHDTLRQTYNAACIRHHGNVMEASREDALQRLLQLGELRVAMEGQYVRDDRGIVYSNVDLMLERHDLVVQRNKVNASYKRLTGKSLDPDCSSSGSDSGIYCRCAADVDCCDA